MMKQCEQNSWHGYPMDSFLFEDREARVVRPLCAANNKLVVKTEYWDAFPEAAELPLLEQGYHLCFLTNDNRWGTDPDLERKARFLGHVRQSYGLEERCVLVGMSCGGLIAIKFASLFPELVSCLYLDAPVVNYMSCPCGFGVGESLASDNSEILNALQLASMAELLAYREMPLDHLPRLTEHRIPAVLVTGDSDRTVPYCENGIFLIRRYEQAGIAHALHVKPGGDHHPHGLPDPAPIVEFILKHS